MNSHFTVFLTSVPRFFYFSPYSFVTSYPYHWKRVYTGPPWQVRLFFLNTASHQQVFWNPDLLTEVPTEIPPVCLQNKPEHHQHYYNSNPQVLRGLVLIYHCRCFHTQHSLKQTLSSSHTCSPTGLPNRLFVDQIPLKSLGSGQSYIQQLFFLGS